MPTDVSFWIVAALALAALVAFSVWRGSNVAVRFKGFLFKADRKDRPAERSEVSVAENTTVGGDVGSVVGRRLASGHSQGTKTEVGKKMTVNGSVGEIVGIDQTNRGS
jgi:hypothetical protein